MHIRHEQDRMVVPCSPELPFLGVQHIMCNMSANMGLSSTLPKYISKPEPSFKINLPENPSEPQKCLCKDKERLGQIENDTSMRKDGFADFLRRKEAQKEATSFLKGSLSPSDLDCRCAQHYSDLGILTRCALSRKHSISPAPFLVRGW